MILCILKYQCSIMKEKIITTSSSCEQKYVILEGKSMKKTVDILVVCSGSSSCCFTKILVNDGDGLSVLQIYFREASSNAKFNIDM